MFGSLSEPFLAHVITRPPDFDQVTAIEIATPQPAWLTTWQGAGMTLKLDGMNAALREGDEVNATQVDAPAAGRAALTVRREFYRETGDLAS
ncbi:MULTISPECIES: hypothetical protein [Bradyrhizobium]|uniref:Uncharacterized protein n=1 Tax=Bradyrhizobium japonicum TaxID=375 RepID=A0A1L3FNX6_BRAJP|nr:MULTISPECIES: hypothetical protein [Bradyrhizobium]APG15044.1 hypothetical protein BKD09_42700 [Bradyrhizobium japonicum]MBR1366610.1 hypothetical protein [Bradyrhizobium ottawaense]